MLLLAYIVVAAAASHEVGGAVGDADEALLGLALHSRVGAGSTIEQSLTDLEEEIDAWGRHRRHHGHIPHSHNPHIHITEASC